MKTADSNATTKGDWRDGFLFLGNHLILDFVNTRPMSDGEPAELLPDASALARWLVAAGLCAPSFPNAWKAARSNSYAKDMKALRAFREMVRSELSKLEHGSEVSPDFLECVNGLLNQHPSVYRLSAQHGRISKEPHFAPKRPSDVFGPLAEDIARLLTDRDTQRLRKCASCALVFLDTSKKGMRRWCSMAMCGNRSKVAAYSRRVRSE